MLIPQYSIRWLLALTAACAAGSSIFGLAVRGSHWAQGVSAALIALVVVLLVHGFVFALVWTFSVVSSPFLRRPADLRRSPFVNHAASPPPKDPEAANDKEIPATPILLE
jgi:hypothetical protein